MDEKEKDLNPQDNAPESEEKNISFEKNDNWQFEASAPTLEDNLKLGNNYEIDIQDIKADTNSSVQTTSNIGSDKIVIRKTPVKIALFAIAAIAIITVLAVLGVRYYTVPNSDEKMNPGNVALTVGDTDVSVGMYNYYYSNIVYNHLNSSDIDSSADYATQYTVDEDGNKISWLDKFKLDTIEQIRLNTVYYEEGVKAGVTLTDDQKDSINQQIESIEQSASDSDMSINEYLSSNYGDYCGVATIRKFLEQINIARNYYGPMQMDMKPSQEELEKYFNENSDSYKSCSYALIEVPYDSTDDSTVASSIENAKKYCNQITDIESMKAAIPEACAEFIQQFISYGYFETEEQAIEELGKSLEITSRKSEIEQAYDSDTAEWLFSSETAEGSTTYCVNEEYGYISIFLKTSQPMFDETEVYSVRHILIIPESADDSQEGENAAEETKEYTEEEWAAALSEAENVLALYNKSDKTEKSFAQLAEEYSDDTESTSAGSSNLYGGAYEGVSLGSMVPEFESWATDDSRKSGDVDIVKSQYGYHIMYFIYDGPEYMFNAQTDLTTKNSQDYVEDYKLKEHWAIKKTKVAEPVAASSSDTQTAY